MSSASRLLFAHAMWRSGSTYLASRFAASERYLLFYEPCHEGISRRPSAARDRDRKRERPLRHPTLEGSYFANYDVCEPETGRPVSTFQAPDISLRSVYNDPSASTLHYLSLLGGAAEARGRTAFLGFCRAGTQMPLAAHALDARSLHLWRAPREQFASYGWPENDYFMAGTVMQLALSRRYGALARQLVPRAFSASLLRIALLLPDNQARSRYRLARHATARLTATETYRLFYLSWLISYRAGRKHADRSFSLTELANSDALRADFEEQYGIVLDDLQPTPDRTRGDIDYAVIETEVEAGVNALTGIPTSDSLYPPSILTRA